MNHNNYKNHLPKFDDERTTIKFIQNNNNNHNNNTMKITYLNSKVQAIQVVIKLKDQTNMEEPLWQPCFLSFFS